MTMPISVRKKDGGKIPGPATCPNVIEIRMEFTLPNGKTSHVVAHGSYAVLPPSMQGLANALWTSISSAWSTDLAPILSTGTTLRNVLVRDMTAATNPVFVGTGTAVPGTSAVAPMPADASIVLTEEVATRGRGLKGRMFLGGFTTAADGGQGTITQTAQDAVTAFGTALNNAITAQALTPCVAQVARQQYQGLTGTIHPARNAKPVNVTLYHCKDAEWDTQRRRGN